MEKVFDKVYLLRTITEKFVQQKSDSALFFVTIYEWTLAAAVGKFKLKESDGYVLCITDYGRPEKK